MAGLLAIGPLGLMAGGPEDHFTDSRELYVLVEGDEWAHVEALEPDAGYWARRSAQLVNWRARGEKARRCCVATNAGVRRLRSRSGERSQRVDFERLDSRKRDAASTHGRRYDGSSRVA